MTRASKTKKIVDGQMGEFKNKNLFFILSGVFWHWIQRSSSESGQESREIQTRIAPCGALLSFLRRHWEKCRLEIEKKRRMERFVVAIFTVQCFYP